jgi:hypothetical protein
MESGDRDLIQRAMQNNFELRKLYEQHKELDEKLRKFSRQAFLTAAEQSEERRLKELKLRGLEKMLKLAAG